MRQTLFFIPDDLWGFPLFGLGWLLALWLVGSAIALAYYVKKQGWDSETKGMPLFIGVVAAVIVFVLPRAAVEVQPHEAHVMLWQPASFADAPAPRGLPIRGYGACLLVATVSGVALATYRAKKHGLSPDAIFGLAFHMFVPGIIGARVFWVIQYWGQIYDPNSVSNTLANMLNFVEGGLVVYGSLIGAMVGAVWYLRRNKLPMLAVADLVAPSLPLGLAIGRIGCLMNGCCFGGVCDQDWAITFPPMSPPYYEQQRHGEFYGFRLAADENGKPIVVHVETDSAAAKAGLKPGMSVQSIEGMRIPNMEQTQRAMELSASNERMGLVVDGKNLVMQLPPLPDRSLPTHPTQVYSSINALLLCLLAIAYFPFRQRDGEVFLLLIGAYAVTRFLLEVIRTDESSFAGTGMTISQNVSVVMLLGVIGVSLWLWKQPRGSFWPTA